MLKNNTGPFIKNKKNSVQINQGIVFALTFLVAFAILKNGVIPYIYGYGTLISVIYPAIIILISILSSVLAEMAYYILVLKEDNLKYFLKNTNSHIYGLILGLILPINTPLYLVILASVVGIVVGKLIFGGTGFNVFNPALIGFIFIITFFGATISHNGGYLNSYEHSIYSNTPISNMQQLNVIAFNNTILPYGNVDKYIVGFIPGGLGTTSVLLCLLGFVILALRKDIKWRITIAYLLTIFFTTFLIGEISGIGLWLPLFVLLTGEVVFTSIFLATDSSTSPVTLEGQTLYGLIGGIITIILMFILKNPYAPFLAILIINMIIPLVDKIGLKINNNLVKTSALALLTIIFIVVTSLSAVLTYTGGI